VGGGDAFFIIHCWVLHTKVVCVIELALPVPSLPLGPLRYGKISEGWLSGMWAQYRVPRSHCLRKHCSRTVRVDPVGRTDTTRSLPGSGLPDTRLHRGLVHGYVQLFRCAKFIRPARFGWASFAGIETLRPSNVA